MGIPKMKGFGGAFQLRLPCPALCAQVVIDFIETDFQPLKSLELCFFSRVRALRGFGVYGLGLWVLGHVRALGVLRFTAQRFPGCGVFGRRAGS